MSIKYLLPNKKDYWFTTLTKASTTNTFATESTADTSGNIYITANLDYSDSAKSTANLIKYNSLGAITFSKNIFFTGAISNFIGVAVDTFENMYVVGNQGSYTVLIKYNTGGVVWQQKIDGTSVSGTSDIFKDVKVDSSGNVYVVGTTKVGSIGTLILVKYNSLGAWQWNRSLDLASEGNALALDLFGNIYVVGNTIETINRGLVIKFNSSGTLVWLYKIPYTNHISAIDVKIDSSSNIIVGIAGSGFSWILKLNGVSSQQLWQISVGKTLKNIALDDLDNLYVGVDDNSGSFNKIVIGKYDTNGNNLYVHSVKSTANNTHVRLNGLSTNKTDTLSITGQLGTTYALTGAVPTANEGLGNFTISGTALTYGNDTFTTGGANLSINYNNNLYWASWDLGSSTPSNPISLTVAAGALYRFKNTASPTWAGVTSIRSGLNGITNQRQVWRNNTTADIAHAHTVDSSGNEYLAGLTNGYSFLTKIGTTNWYKSILTNSAVSALKVDSAFNLFVLFNYQYTSSNTNGATVLVKFNSAGVEQWRTGFDLASQKDVGTGISIDSAGNIYTVGYSNVATRAFLFFAKYTSTGSLVFQKQITSTNYTCQGLDIAIDTDDSIYIAGVINGKATIMRCDTSANIVWQKEFTGSTSRASIKLTTEHILLVSMSNLIKLDKSGNFVKAVSADGGIYGMDIDSNLDIYVQTRRPVSGGSSAAEVVLKLPYLLDLTGTFVANSVANTVTISDATFSPTDTAFSFETGTLPIVTGSVLVISVPTTTYLTTTAGAVLNYNRYTTNVAINQVTTAATGIAAGTTAPTTVTYVNALTKF